MSAQEKKELNIFEEKHGKVSEESDSLQKLRTQILAKKEFEHRLMTNGQQQAPQKKPNALYDELAKKANALQQEVSSEPANDNTELFDKVSELEGLVSELKVKNEELLSKADDHSETDALIASLNADHEKALNDLSQHYDELLAKASDESKSDLAMKDKEIADLKKELEEVSLKANKDSENANKKYSDDLAKYEKKLAELSDKLEKNDADAIKARYDEEIANLKAHYENLMIESGNGNASENLTALITSFEQQRDTTIREVRSSSSRSVNALKRQIEKMKKDMSKYKSDLSKASSSLSNNELKHKREVEDLKKKVAAANKDADLMKKSLKETRVSVLKGLTNQDVEKMREQLEDEQRKLQVTSEQVEMEAQYLKLYREELDQKYKKEISTLKDRIRDLENAPIPEVITEEAQKESDLNAKLIESANNLEKVSKNACELELLVNELREKVFELENAAPVETVITPDLSPELDEANAKLAECESLLNAANAKIEELEALNASQNDSIDSFKSEIAALNKEIAYVKAENAQYAENEKARTLEINNKLADLMSFLEQNRDSMSDDEEIAKLEQQINDELAVEKELYRIIEEKERTIENLKEKISDYRDQIQALQYPKYPFPYSSLPITPFIQQPYIQPQYVQQGPDYRAEFDKRDAEIKDLAKKQEENIQELEKKRADDLATLLDKLAQLEETFNNPKGEAIIPDEEPLPEPVAEPEVALDLQFPEEEVTEVPVEEVVAPVEEVEEEAPTPIVVVEEKYNAEFLNKLNNIIRTRKVIENRLVEVDREYEDDLAKNSALQEEYEKKIADLKAELDAINEQHKNHKNYSEKEVKEYELNKSRIFNDLVIREDTLNKLSYDEVGRIRTRHNYNVRLLKDELDDLDRQEEALRARYGYPKEEEVVSEAPQVDAQVSAPQPVQEEPVRIIESMEEKAERDFAYPEELSEETAEVPVMEKPAPQVETVEEEKPQLSEEDRYNNLVTAKRLEILESKYRNAIADLESKNDNIMRYKELKDYVDGLKREEKALNAQLEGLYPESPDAMSLTNRINGVRDSIDDSLRKMSKYTSKKDVRDYAILTSKLNEVERLKEQFR